ncbi:Formate dehydrogenase, nitrate-inducible, iron-sulfur subunit [Aquisphaera giovannonii]|uniref:Formate dehydrogenase, nitrate-inducible, iron-sulfur subunit n=1 Tax=Aquisphaera giovannonii TaxID=406548 RepID=A0A5B9VUG7_9BACT|nr:4Fe-4S dicluster domain-containing protein [Aquisphaera giovannonii]QEH31739.1 Formate dehydrogenase, nitrate-inducible, iron-sulfur subunit [Aquisphaera giovannonii]
MAVSELEVAARPSPPETSPRRGLAASLARRLVGPFLRGEMPPPRPATGFYTDTTVCIGCKACEVACKQWNQLPADGFRWTGNSYDNTETLSASSWRHVKFVEQFAGPEPPATPGDPAVAAPRDLTVHDLLGDGPSGRWLMMSDVCKHCVAAPCQHACPTGAIIYNEFANVYIQPDICNGCAYCVAACPFGVITRSAIDGVAHKCTLCYDRQRDGLTPACAKACPTASIQFGPIEELRERGRRRVAELHERGVHAAHLYGDESTDRYSSLNSFYLLVDRPEVYGLPGAPSNPWLSMPGDYGRAALTGLLTLAAMLAALFLSGR